MKSWGVTATERARIELARHRNHSVAGAAERNIQFVAPFLGITSEDRRLYLDEAWSALPEPTSNDLGEAVTLLMRLPEREYHYAAHDLLATHIEVADEQFLPNYIEVLLTTAPYRDTVDAFTIAGVSPLCKRYGHADVVQRWSESGDQWLIRAALQHQCTWGADTDVDRVLELCERHWDAEEFFVATGVGAAIASAGRVDRPRAIAFLEAHEGNQVAHQEANRRLGRL